MDSLQSRLHLPGIAEIAGGDLPLDGSLKREEPEELATLQVTISLLANQFTHNPIGLLALSRITVCNLPVDEAEYRLRFRMREQDFYSEPTRTYGRGAFYEEAAMIAPRKKNSLFSHLKRGQAITSETPPLHFKRQFVFLTEDVDD